MMRSPAHLIFRGQSRAFVDALYCVASFVVRVLHAWLGTHSLFQMYACCQYL
ncbi:hypothetical protein BDQ94DRAFT_148887 [Aspergillus welwitschiae]|uniref:Uncharacterized protein n=1 Tax=Aspergillus welwitschiae TaxID=1341132 RepID=A0A3F3PTY4_9EURO|nr:hypothetical protein BDQ94DRAFT_148887 [Aspergillus welwitschiae]RDH30363.1 hypothetical protein BDQ94DRAFT_148887 [Aspergillus welwitschiae]